jgi:hypothetical protein
MAEVAGSNPAEPIVLFAIGNTAAVYRAFVGGEDCGEKEAQRGQKVAQL